MSSVDEESRSYAAGFLDGEGCFVIGSNRKITVIAENTYLPVINWLQQMFGGSITACKGKKANHRTTYRWCVVSRDAMCVCQTLVPYLREKREQAALLIAFQQTIGGIGRRVPAEVKVERERLGGMVKALKGRLAA